MRYLLTPIPAQSTHHSPELAELPETTDGIHGKISAARYATHLGVDIQIDADKSISPRVRRSPHSNPLVNPLHASNVGPILSAVRAGPSHVRAGDAAPDSTSEMSSMSLLPLEYADAIAVESMPNTQDSGLTRSAPSAMRLRFQPTPKTVSEIDSLPPINGSVPMTLETAQSILGVVDGDDNHTQ